jgi:hypothetical protein
MQATNCPLQLSPQQALTLFKSILNEQEGD